MSLLTAEQLDAATVRELYKTYRALNDRLRDVEQTTLLDAATSWLEVSNVPYVARLIVETNSYENGYYYENATAQDSDGTTAWLPPGVGETLQAALEGPLAELSHSFRTLGQEDILVIDLRARTLTQARRWDVFPSGL
jgi:hypothetical protein